MTSRHKRDGTAPLRLVCMNLLKVMLLCLLAEFTAGSFHSVQTLGVNFHAFEKLWIHRAYSTTISGELSRKAGWTIRQLAALSLGSMNELSLSLR